MLIVIQSIALESEFYYCCGEESQFYYCCSEESSLTSSFSLTNSLATSSVVLWERILRMVHPVSSIWILLPRDSQQAQEP